MFSSLRWYFPPVSSACSTSCWSLRSLWAPNMWRGSWKPARTGWSGCWTLWWASRSWRWRTRRGQVRRRRGLQSALWLYTWADLFISDVRHWRQVMRSLPAWLCYKSLNVNKDSAGNGGKNTITWPRWRHKNACLRLETVKNIINDKEKH